jgi:Na+-driven multidrug efflux pump
MAVVQIPRAVVTVMNGSIRGTGDVHWLMWIAFLTVLIFELGGSWLMIFTLNLGLAGLWLMQGGEELFRLGFYYWRFKGAKWKVFKI